MVVVGSVWEKRGKQRKVVRQKISRGKKVVTWMAPGSTQTVDVSISAWSRWTKDARLIADGFPGRGGARQPGPGKRIGRTPGVTKPAEEKRIAFQIMFPPPLLEKINAVAGPRMRSKFIEKCLTFWLDHDKCQVKRDLLNFVWPGPDRIKVNVTLSRKLYDRLNHIASSRERSFYVEIGLNYCFSYQTKEATHEIS